MSKPAYNIGDLVAAEDDSRPPKLVIGWIQEKYKYHDGSITYYVQWSDGEQDRYSEDNIKNYKKLLDKIYR